mmetsp:Transcript_65666/g.212611  ORF Transcript_65666/g.212611 Transcript_65666/m.212611 type:complete len:365 (-) Transcript_65666:201-1295(-)
MCRILGQATALRGRSSLSAPPPRVFPQRSTSFKRGHWASNPRASAPDKLQSKTLNSCRLGRDDSNSCPKPRRSIACKWATLKFGGSCSSPAASSAERPQSVSSRHRSSEHGGGSLSSISNASIPPKCSPTKTAASKLGAHLSSCKASSAVKEHCRKRSRRRFRQGKRPLPQSKCRLKPAKLLYNPRKKTARLHFTSTCARSLESSLPSFPKCTASTKGAAMRSRGAKGGPWPSFSTRQKRRPLSTQAQRSRAREQAATAWLPTNRSTVTFSGSPPEPPPARCSCNCSKPVTKPLSATAVLPHFARLSTNAEDLSDRCLLSALGRATRAVVIAAGRLRLFALRNICILFRLLGSCCRPLRELPSD